MNIQDRFVLKVSGKVIPVPGDNIDTDRIIPARFMKGITFDGLGEYAFFDERIDESGKKKNHPFNDDKHAGGSILLVESNFGCGSSREHAPQSLAKYGIRALIGISFADIFAGNCVQLGIPAVKVTKDNLAKLFDIVNNDSTIQCTIDLEKKSITAGSITIPLSMDDHSSKALTSGLWDTTSVLLENRDAIAAKAKELPYIKMQVAN
jgi:3-isopropylmalate/(R)-2-methylmalate dehydratase small subunit